VEPWPDRRGRLPTDLDNCYSPYVELTGDIAQTLQALSLQLQRSQKPALSSGILETIRAERKVLSKEAAARGGLPIHPLRLVHELQQLLGSDCPCTFSGNEPRPAQAAPRLGRKPPFDAIGAKPGDYYPQALRGDIDTVNARIYDTLNNGVYKAGFATTQAAYEEAVIPLFDTLDWLEKLLADRRFLFGDSLTEADIRLFTTLIRFDAVYAGHFKCNIRRIADYPNLSAYTRDIYQWSGIAATVNPESYPSGLFLISPLRTSASNWPSRSRRRRSIGIHPGRRLDGR